MRNNSPYGLLGFIQQSQALPSSGLMGQFRARPEYQVADALTEINGLVSSYAKGGISARELRAKIPRMFPGYSIDKGGLRGNSSDIPIVTPEGKIVYLQT